MKWNHRKMNDKKVRYIQLDRVSASFSVAGERLPVLNGVSLRIRAGEWVAVTGRNGSGKSTLARVLAGIHRINEGSMTNTFDGEMSVGMVFQQPDAQFLGETVWEEVCAGLEHCTAEEAERRAQTALERVGLGAYRDKSVRTLSGGQKQLLAIAGCLAAGTPVIVFDEPSSMLDTTMHEKLLRVVKDLHRQGSTVIWLTQLPEEWAEAERLIVLEHGAIRFDGTPRLFFYGAAGKGKSQGEELGWPAPYAVRVARHLQAKGMMSGDSQPLTPEELEREVGAVWRSLSNV
jgi:energy-coupling factor transport system ATP-binding protein